MSEQIFTFKGEKCSGVNYGQVSLVLFPFCLFHSLSSFLQEVKVLCINNVLKIIIVQNHQLHWSVHWLSARVQTLKRDIFWRWMHYQFLDSLLDSNKHGCEDTVQLPKYPLKQVLYFVGKICIQFGVLELSSNWNVLSLA